MRFCHDELTLDDMLNDPLIGAMMQADGVDYRKLLRGAVAYDRASLRALFRYTANGKLMGEGADTNCEILHHLLEIWGDSRFAAVLSQEPARVRVAVIAAVDYDYPHWRPTAYPKTYRLATHEKF